MSVPMAIALSGQLILGQPMMVKPSEGEKNHVQATATTSSSVTGPYGQTDQKLYVGIWQLALQLDGAAITPDLRANWSCRAGVAAPLTLRLDTTKAFGFVQFAQVEHAKAAQSLNGKVETAGRYIKTWQYKRVGVGKLPVSFVTEHVGGQDADTNTADFDDDDGGGLVT